MMTQKQRDAIRESMTPTAEELLALLDDCDERASDKLLLQNAMVNIKESLTNNYGSRLLASLPLDNTNGIEMLCEAAKLTVEDHDRLSKLDEVSIETN